RIFRIMFEHVMFKKVSEAGLSRSFVFGSNLVPYVADNHRKHVFLMQDDGQSVGQLVFFIRYGAHSLGGSKPRGQQKQCKNFDFHDQYFTEQIENEPRTNGPSVNGIWPGTIWDVRPILFRQPFNAVARTRRGSMDK